jgi:hypothetical protein
MYKSEKSFKMSGPKDMIDQDIKPNSQLTPFFIFPIHGLQYTPKSEPLVVRSNK